MAASEPLNEYSFDPTDALWVETEGCVYGYLLQPFDITDGELLKILVQNGESNKYYLGLTEASCIKDGELVVTVSGKNYKLTSTYDYEAMPLCKLATTADELIGSTTVTKPGADYSLAFVIFGKDGKMYTSNAYSSVNEKFDIDITDSIDNSTLSLDITVTGLTYGAGTSLTLSIPTDKINSGNPYLYLLYCS
jgi:hypothetical protein